MLQNLYIIKEKQSLPPFFRPSIDNPHPIWIIRLPPHFYKKILSLIPFSMIFRKSQASYKEGGFTLWVLRTRYCKKFALCTYLVEDHSKNMHTRRERRRLLKSEKKRRSFLSKKHTNVISSRNKYKIQQLNYVVFGNHCTLCCHQLRS